MQAEVLQQQPYGPGHFWLDLDVPSGFVAPVPGQFAQLLLPPALGSSFLPRPMSVAGVQRKGSRMTIGFLYAAVGPFVLSFLIGRSKDLLRNLFLPR